MSKWISGYAAMGALVAFFIQHDTLVALLSATTSLGFLWIGLDSVPASVDTLPKGQDAKQGLAGTESGAVPKADAQGVSHE